MTLFRKSVGVQKHRCLVACVCVCVCVLVFCVAAASLSSKAIQHPGPPVLKQHFPGGLRQPLRYCGTPDTKHCCSAANSAFFVLSLLLSRSRFMMPTSMKYFRLWYLYTRGFLCQELRRRSFSKLAGTLYLERSVKLAQLQLVQWTRSSLRSHPP